MFNFLKINNLKINVTLIYLEIYVKKYISLVFTLINYYLLLINKIILIINLNF